MSSTTQILKENNSQQFYHAEITNEEGVVTPRRWLLTDEWRTSTTLWMMLVAVALWLTTYLMTVFVTSHLDRGLRSVASLSVWLGWTNGTSLIINEDNTKYVITY